MSRPVFAWRIHLAAEKPLRSVAVGVAFVAGGVGIGWLYRSPSVGGLVVVLLFGSTAAYWWPREYRICEDRLEVHYSGWPRTIQYPWSRFRRLAIGSSALLLSPVIRPAWLARYRGVTVFLPSQAEPIVRYIQERLEGAAGAEHSRGTDY